MIASLMMYKNDSVNPVIKRYWTLIRDQLAHRGIDAPPELSQSAGELEVWLHPQLVLSQTCGMPYRLWLKDDVSLVGTPDFGVQGCAPGYYRSVCVVRANDSRDEVINFKDARFAYNKTWSQSGYAAAYGYATAHGFWFADRIETGQHLASARAVAQGEADIAALDPVTWALMKDHEPFNEITQQLRELAWTEPTPGLPYITSASNDATLIFDSITSAIAQLSQSDRDTLHLKGIVRIERESYLAVPNPPNEDYRIPA
jgi:ABC-type phosphate/phosphonate transport system substrate-binding protein